MKKISMFTVAGVTILSSFSYGRVRPSNDFPHREGEVIVKIRPGQMSRFLGKKGQLSGNLKSTMTLLSGQYAVIHSQAKSANALISELKSLPEVLYAEPNYIYKAIDLSQNSPKTSVPSDPSFGKLWGLKNTGANEPDRSGDLSDKPGKAGADLNIEKAWTISQGSKQVVIAVIDTGIDYNHEDLKNNIWVNSKEIPDNGIDDDGNGYIDDRHGWNVAGKNGRPLDGNSHGTHCAGTIAAEHNNKTGISGVMAHASLMAVKFLSDGGSGSLEDAIVAIDYATKMNVDIMSNSWGGGGFSQALEDSIKVARDKGILFVAAAGNDGTNNDSRPHYPSNYELENVISVAAHTAQDSMASFSCFGKRTVHVTAPGYNILSTAPNNTYKVLSGTSMATPHVSGVLGLLLSKEGRLPVSEVRQRLIQTSSPVAAYRRAVVAGGRVDAFNFLTNTRTPRQGPDEGAWRDLALSETFETGHPYGNNEKKSKTYTFPGAKYVKLILEKYETEENYDFITVTDGNGVVIDNISGRGEKYETEYAETDSLTISFTSDSSQTGFGVIVRDVRVVY